MFRVSRNGDGAAAKHTIDEVREFVRAQPPGCYEVEEVPDDLSPSGLASRPWGTIIRHPDGRLVEDRRPCPPEIPAPPADSPDPYRKPALIALSGVIIIWAISLSISIGTWRSEEKKGLGELGQIGDSLGVVNALFTGVALAGLLYTILLQRKQAAEQEADSRENQSTRRREAREQFLTARLNATTAVVHAAGVRARLVLYGRPADETRFELYAARREAIENSQRLSILLHEIRMGFHRDWDLIVEREAIRTYLIDIFADYARDFNDLPEVQRYPAQVDFRLSFFQRIAVSRSPDKAGSSKCLTMDRRSNS